MYISQGRMLHVLPSTIKKEKPDSSDGSGSSSYKRQKDAKNKASSARYLFFVILIIFSI